MNATSTITRTIDPTAPTPPPQERRWPTVLPWVVAGLLLLALAASLRTPPPVLSAPQPPAESVVDVRTSDGLSDGATVRRDAAGRIVAVLEWVRPFTADGAAWCQITVDGQTVRQDETDGRVAVCLWVRG